MRGGGRLLPRPIVRVLTADSELLRQLTLNPSRDYQPLD
jgi:hypothetical protein